MKTQFILIAILTLIVFNTNGQRNNEETTFNEALAKLSQSTINEAHRTAKKEARQYKRKGYYTNIASLSMENQIEKAKLYAAVINAEGQHKYIVESSNVLSKSPEAGKQHAIETAKIIIAGYLQTAIFGLVELALSNNQLSMKEAEMINKMVSNYENWIAQNLGPIEPIGTIYKRHNDKIEVEATIAYNVENAANTTRNAVINKLEEDTKISKSKLEEVLKRNNFRSLSQDKSN